jgi:hypothetical protein
MDPWACGFMVRAFPQTGQTGKVQIRVIGDDGRRAV